VYTVYVHTYFFWGRRELLPRPTIQTRSEAAKKINRLICPTAMPSRRLALIWELMLFDNKID